MAKKKTKDPVCRMEVSTKKAEHRSEHQGSTYYFCSSACKTQFDSSPDQYVTRRAA